MSVHNNTGGYGLYKAGAALNVVIGGAVACLRGYSITSGFLLGGTAALVAGVVTEVVLEILLPENPLLKEKL